MTYAALGSEFQVNTTTFDDQWLPQITTLADGSFVVVWRDESQQGGDTSYWSVKGRHYAADGTAIGTEFLVNTTTNSSQYHPTVTGLASGGFVVTWNDESGAGGDSSGSSIKAQVFEADGSRVGSEFLVNSVTDGNQFWPQVAALDSGGFAIVWQDYGGSDGSYDGIKGQLYSANGATVGSEFTVNTTTSMFQSFPAITSLASGGFAVSWTDLSESSDQSDIYAQIFDASGIPVGGEIHVNTITANQQDEASIAGLANGGFVVSWMDYGSAGPASGTTNEIKAQIFDANGGAVGSEFSVSGNDFYPIFTKVAGLANGDFVVTWGSWPNPSPREVNAQVYHADGQPIGDSFVLGTNTSSSWAAITGLQDGGFVAAWSTLGAGSDGSGFAVKAQIYASDSAPAVAQNDAFTTDELTAITGNVFADNGFGPDSDPNGLTIIAVNGEAANVGSQFATDSGALLTVNADGSFSYDPNGAFEQTPTFDSGATNTPSGDTFSYTLAGGETATVIITIDGVDNNDTVLGSDGADVLTGGVGDDLIFGLDGNDLIRGRAGNDYIDGGDGFDRAGYYHLNEAAGGVHVDLNISGAQDTGSQGWDTLTSIEYVSGTPFADVLIGDANDNVLWGSTATIDPDTNWVSTSNNDTLDGGGGDDLLIVGIGNHSLTGGDGIDTVGFTENFGNDPAINVSLALQGQAQDTGQGMWTLNGVENLGGGDDNDQLTGDDNANILAGNGGDDLLSGGGGNDALYGDGVFDTDSPSSGPPTLFPDTGANGNDTLDGGAGDDQLYGGGGNDTASFASETGGVQAFLYNGGFGEAFAADGYDQLHDIENLTGSAFGDLLNGNNLANILDGGDGNDSLAGGAGADTLYGGNGNDGLSGGGGNDALYGGTGNDFLNGGFGDDTIDGGDGFDRIGYFGGSTTGVTVDLRLQGQAQYVGEQGWDTISNVEGVSGTTFADTLTGDDNDNWLWGSIGGTGGTNNDTLDGQGGNDLLEVGIGNHSLTGGSGVDTVMFSENGGTEPDVAISLALQDQAQVTGAGSWILSGIENLSGGIGNDALTGDEGRNVLAGNVGNDTLSGGGGDDILYGDGLIVTDNRPTGGSGPITTFTDATDLNPAAIDGDDTLDGGAGNDQLYGGGGNDTASYASATGNVFAYLYDGGFGEAFGAAGYDQLHDIENLSGSAFNDVLYGNSQDNVVSGGAGHDDVRGGDGNDQLYGGGGDDLLYGNAGDDYIDGGDGVDRVGFFSGATAGVHVDLNLQGVAQDTGQGMDTLVNIENVSGTQFADTLIGDEGDNVLWGSASGNAGGTNNDTLIGNGGNDLLVAGIGDHTIDGGADIDTFRFTENGGPETGITLSLLLQGQAQASGNGNWTLSGIENLSGSLSDDHLTGDGNANVLAGDLGNDTLIGGAGNDTLYGDAEISWDGHGTGRSGPITTFMDATSLYVGGVAGNDTLEGGLGDDLINGGGGIDTASYAHASGGVTVTLNNNLTGNGSASGADGNDTLQGIENVIGSAHDDSLTGSAANNVLSGGDGNDLLVGRGGDDALYGGDGNDFLSAGVGNDLLDGGAGYDRAAFSQGASNGVTVDLRIQGTAQNTGLGNDTLVGIENLSGTVFSDVLTGNDGDNWIWGVTDSSFATADTIDGQGGNDLIEVGAGDHILTGGTGNDTLLYNPFGDGSVGATISLALQGAAQNTGAGSITLSGFENLSGGDFADTLTGDGNDNVLGGALGDDTLVGGDGSDSLYGDGVRSVDSPNGGSGPITFFDDVGTTFGVVAGNDLLEGGLGNDMLDGGGGVDTATYAHASGGVNVNLGTGTASGADGNDTLVNIENVTGSEFADGLTGNGGNNVLDGLGGNDTISGNAGDDTIYGGDGDDFLQGDLNENNITVSGNDILYGGNGNDGLRGGLGDDQLYGGAGNDLLRGNAGVDYFDGGADDGEGFNGIGDRVSFYDMRATQGVVADLRTGIISNDGYGNVETMVNIESLGAGTAYSDTLYGNDGRNFLAGDRGDYVYGFGGDDIFQVGSAAAVIDGGTGIDRLALFAAAGLLTPDSNGDGLAESLGAPTVGFTLNLTAGTLLDGWGYTGSVTGIENADGSALGDTLIGEGGANVLNGGDGDDVLDGRGGNDTLDGGNGIDTASYAGATGAVTVTLTAGGAGTSSGADGNDVLAGIENLTGGGFNDVLNGNGGANMLDGGAGHDKLSGGSGNDVLLGGLGDDMLTGGAGDDTINGGAGYDRAAYFGATSGVTVSLAIAGAQNTGGAGIDTLIGIENLTGTQYSDTLIGDGNDNWLWGFATTAGTTNNDTLNGGGGNDLLWAGNGNMTLIGGSGNDTVMYNQNFSGDVAVTISLATAAAQNTGQGMWTLSGIENLVGGTANDKLTGDGNANILAGGAGTDTIDGGAGNDTIYGDGEITFDDHGTGGSGPIIIVPDAIATFGGVAGADILSGGDGDDFIYGGAGNDVIKGDKDNDTLYGGTGNDTLTGGNGNDRYVIEANSGADTISGFAHLVDKIVFDDSSGVTNYAQLTLTKVGTNTMITWGNGNSITLTGLKPADLSSADFQFNPAAASFEHASHDFATNYTTPHDVFL